MIRIAEQKDRDEVIELLRLAHENAGYSFPFHPSYAGRLFHNHTAMGHAVCFVLDRDGVQGVLMANVMEHPFGAGLYAKETVWFIHPDYRGREALKMLKEYERWAKERGCRFIGMASLPNSELSKLYGRAGFKTAETHFVKELY